MQRPNRWVLLGSGSLAAIVAVGACMMLLGSEPHYVRKEAEPLATYDIPEPPPAPALVQPPSVNEPMPATAAIPVSVPQIAYSYTLGYRLPAGAIARAQQAQLDLCKRWGRAASWSRCSGRATTTAFPRRA